MNIMRFRGEGMAEDDEFLRGIPKFLRRPQEPMPEKPIFMAASDGITPPPADIPAAIQAAAEAPSRRPGALVPPQPVKAGPEPTEVVDLPSRRAMPAVSRPALDSGDFFAAAHKKINAGIADLFGPDARNTPDEQDDAAFQVTLPRSVIRQIRILAAQEGTTQRAIVLKALRLAGLAVPEGADIDRRILAGKRRQQA